jgi:Bax protein
MIKHILFICYLFSTILIADGLPKEYYEIRDTSKKKKEFFKFINNLATIENNLIREDRQYIKNNYSKHTPKMLNLQKRYKLKANASLNDYLNRVDIVPVSMIMAQAALESAWGKSRFFKEAKNIFGQWTWKGKGLVPKHRKAGLTHKIKLFSTYQNSLRSYLLNINRGWAYKKLRTLRAKLRAENKIISGSILAAGLDKYSGKKEQYVDIIRSVIRHNNLSVYDTY